MFEINLFKIISNILVNQFKILENKYFFLIFKIQMKPNLNNCHRTSNFIPNELIYKTELCSVFKGFDHILKKQTILKKIIIPDCFSEFC